MDWLVPRCPLERNINGSITTGKQRRVFQTICAHFSHSKNRIALEAFLSSKWVKIRKRGGLQWLKQLSLPIYHIRTSGNSCSGLRHSYKMPSELDNCFYTPVKKKAKGNICCLTRKLPGDLSTTILIIPLTHRGQLSTELGVHNPHYFSGLKSVLGNSTSP